MLDLYSICAILEKFGIMGPSSGLSLLMIEGEIVMGLLGVNTRIWFHESGNLLGHSGLLSKRLCKSSVNFTLIHPMNSFFEKGDKD